MLVFAAILVYSGVRIARPGRTSQDSSEATDPTPSRWTPSAVRDNPALAALLAITVVDVAFAADSILAAFAITTSGFAIVAANVFAVLGLRPLYLVLNSGMERFRYLRVGIGVLLVSIGIELAAEHFVVLPSWLTLGVVAACLLTSVGASVVADTGITMRQLLRRIAVTAVGLTLLLAGVAMLVLPGPGILVIAGGLAVLATEYAWAKRPLDMMRRRLDKLRNKPS
jgi:tellurite resistance protein TerC